MFYYRKNLKHLKTYSYPPPPTNLPFCTLYIIDRFCVWRFETIKLLKKQNNQSFIMIIE